MRLFSNFNISAAIVLLAGITATPFAEGASCCGGGFATPSLITGDEKATVTTELSYSNVKTEVSHLGIWHDRSSPESIETLKLQAAHIFADRFQTGVTAPVVRRSRGEAASTGLGDIGFNLGYETLPEWEYSAWRPRGVSYVSLVLPTGRSIQEATETSQLDSRGRGFWAVGFGTTLTKSIRRFDVLASAEVHRSFAREVKTGVVEGELIPGYGGLVALGAGASFNDTRVGANLSLNYEDAVETRGSMTSQGAPSRFATATLTGSQMFGDAWAASVSIFDQTLFGAPTNTSLARGISISAQRRFSR